MPLPVLNTPTYTIKLPSTGKDIEYRPFLVKEEKILMIAQESKDQKQVMKAMRDIISSCTFGKVNADDCTVYDIEYLFLQLRSKSVGEIANVKIRCSKCGEYTPVEINLDEVGVIYPKEKIDPNIKLTDTVGIKLRPMQFRDAMKIQSDKDISGTIATVIESIYDSDNVYDIQSISKKELDAFIDSMNRKQLESIQKFIENQPRVQHIIEFDCEKCGHKNRHVLTGLASFFE